MSIITLLVLGSLFYFSFADNGILASQEFAIPSYSKPVFKDLTNHEAIEISSDSDLDLSSFAGDGSQVTPYVIENYYIEVTNHTGISIHDTTHYFIIRNCYVSADQYGISLYSRTIGNTTIEDCIVTDNFYCGIYVNDEVFTLIENNTIFNNWGYGIYANGAAGTKIKDNKLYDNNNNPIYVQNTDGAQISFNECWNNGRDNIYVRLSDFIYAYNNTIYDSKDFYGFRIEFCFDSVIANNLCYNLTYGISVEDSDEIILDHNEIHETVYYGISAFRCANSEFEYNKISDVGTYGMDIYDCLSSSVRFNTFNNDGLLISADTIADYRTYTVESNTVNGKPLGFFIDLESATFDTPTHGQLILVNCTFTEIFNQELYNTDIGLYLWECNDTLVSSNVMNFNFLGMSVYKCYNTFTEFNTFNNNEVQGVGIYNSNNTYVIYSDLNFNDAGVHCYNAPYTTVNNNDVIGNSYDGIQLSYSPNSTVKSNFIQENGLSEMFDLIDNGINFDNSPNSTITHNNLLMNGIKIYEPALADYRTYDLTSNEVNGLPYGYLVDLNNFPITGSDYGQVFLINCSDFTIDDMTFSYASNGLMLVYCNNSVISNIVSINGNYGIGISFSENIEIASCTLEYNFLGLSVEYGKYINIHNNDLFYNSFDGCTLYDVDNSTISDNKVAYNKNNGIQLAYGEYNELTFNLLQENKYYGIKLGVSDHNLIHHNTFYENNPLGYTDGMFTGYAQGYDSKTTSLWYDDSVNEGNWWSDWSGVGSYVLDGGFFTYNEDLYPLGAQPIPVISEYKTEMIILIPTILIPVLLISFRKKKR